MLKGLRTEREEPLDRLVELDQRARDAGALAQKLVEVEVHDPCAGAPLVGRSVELLAHLVHGLLIGCDRALDLALEVAAGVLGQAEGQYAEMFLQAISEDDFKAAFNMLSDQLKDEFEDPQSFQEEYLANYPIPMSWEVNSVPGPSISRHSRHLRYTDVRGTLIDADQQTWRWIIDVDGPIFSRDIERYRVSVIELVRVEEES